MLAELTGVTAIDDPHLGHHLSPAEQAAMGEALEKFGYERALAAALD